MMTVVTITMNPVIDASTSANAVVPSKKTRCKAPVYEPGGGGINVSRALKKLGCDSMAVFFSGGRNGKILEQLIKNENINFRVLPTEESTRENIMVMDNKTGEHYRFVMPGPNIKDNEWQSVLDLLDELSPLPDYLVASGSLPPGVPDDFYARVAKWANKHDVKMILDTSGRGLKPALEEGVYLTKPNLRELGELLNNENLTGMQLDEAAREILAKRYTRILVVSLGAKGALLAQGDMLHYVVPPVMPVVSAVGAGDSMVAGILCGCLKGYWPQKAVHYGVAAGTAATMTPGSELCKKSDTDKIFKWLCTNRDEDE
ncbi:MAG: 1-phosphofructokinase family hexose kinase [Bacteroidota bacterium]